MRRCIAIERQAENRVFLFVSTANRRKWNTLMPPKTENIVPYIVFDFFSSVQKKKRKEKEKKSKN